jgi:hypothetical protein
MSAVAEFDASSQADPLAPTARSSPDMTGEAASRVPAMRGMPPTNGREEALPAQTDGSGTDAFHASVASAVHEAVHLHFRDHLAKIAELVEETAQRGVAAGAAVVPAWRRKTEGEPRWPVALTIVAAAGLQLVVPQELVVHPVWLLPGIELLLLAMLIAANPRRINRDHRLIRAGSLTLVAVATFANVWTAAHLVEGLIQGTDKHAAPQLLGYGAAIWATNVIVFALWYWEFDRGGPVERAKGSRPHPDFQFPQMQTPDIAHDEWEPTFIDYLYLSFTNATAFSPTDTLPMSRWAKMGMLTQSCVSLVTVALVVARAVNILG